MDVPRGSCGVEVMTPGVVASEGMLYQEADRGPATPRARFGEAPLHLRRCFWTFRGSCGLRSSYGGCTQWKRGGPEGEGCHCRRAGRGHARKRVSRMCNNKPDKERGRIRLRHRNVSQPSRVLHTSLRRPTLTSVFCQFQTDNA
jgi:hypothetical protein